MAHETGRVSGAVDMHAPRAAIWARHGLQGSQSEADIAIELKLTSHTVHTCAKLINRKFNVQGRSGLMGLWLGR